MEYYQRNYQQANDTILYKNMSIICSQKFVTLISIIPACGNLPEQIRWLLMSDVKLGKVYGIHFGTCTQFRPIKATYPSCLQIDDFSSVRFFQDIILRQKKRELCRQNFVLDCDGSGYQNRRCSGLRGSPQSVIPSFVIIRRSRRE